MLGVCSAVMPRRESPSAARAVPPLRIRFAGPAGDAPRLLLAHGAGAGMDSEFMSAVARGLGALGVRVARFEFEYMARRRTGVRPPPDRLPRLFARFRAAAERVGPLDQLVIGGKSMGGRIASMLADELGVKGVLCLGYPFHPPTKLEQTRTQHLSSLRSPCLIVQGTRDPFGTREEVAGYALSRSICLEWIEDGDHDLQPRRRSGFDPEAARQQLLLAAASFVRSL